MDGAGRRQEITLEAVVPYVPDMKLKSVKRLVKKEFSLTVDELTFTVDDCSLRKFKDRKFVLNFRYGQIQITKQRPVQSAKKEEVPTIPNAVPDEMAMDCEVVHEDPIVPGTSAVGNRSFANSKNITLSSEKEEGLTGANNDLDDQGQHNAHGNHKSGADDSGSQGQYNTHGLKKSKARKPCGSNPISSIQNRLQRRE